MVPAEWEYTTDRNILAYHLKKKKYSAHKKRGHVAVVGRMSHHSTQNLQHFKLPPTGPHPRQQCTLSQQTLPFCQLRILTMLKWTYAKYCNTFSINTYH